MHTVFYLPNELAMNRPVAGVEPKPLRRNMKPLVIVATIAVVAVIVLGVILISGFNLPRHHITAYGELLFVSHHSSSGEVIDTDTTLIWVPVDDQYMVGRQIKWDETFHNPGTGVLNITSIVCTTPGFTFAGCSPALPATLPNTATKEEGAIMLTLTFDTPSTQYTGPLNYTIYYDLFVGPLVGQPHRRGPT